MAGNKYSPTRGGQALHHSISATAWNEMLAMLADWKASRNREGTGRSNKPWSGTTCTVYNNSGSDVPMWGILAIDSPKFGPGVTKPEDTDTDASRGFQESGLYFTGVAPVAGGKFVVALRPIKAGEMGKAVCAGPVLCRLDVEDDEATYTGADMIGDDSEKLSAGGSGWASIIWKQEGEGTVWGVISIGGASGCAPQNEVQTITIFGQPTGGTFGVVLTLKDDDDLDVTETIEIAFDANAAAVTTALEGHSEATPGDFLVTGAGFPNNEMRVEFQGELENTHVDKMLAADLDDLTGGSGVGVQIIPVEHGHPN
jgi:hypothetical protein